MITTRLKRRMIILVEIKHRIILAVILILSGSQTYSQEGRLKGILVDYETNRTIAGATIIDVNNPRNGTISDGNGNDQLEAGGNKINLELYFVGYYPERFIHRS